MSAVRCEFPAITRGDDYTHRLEFVEDDETTAVDLSGRTYEAQARVTPGATDPVFTFAIDTTDAADGVLVLTLAHTDTADLPVRLLVGDLEETATGVVTTLLHFSVPVEADVTR